MFILSLPVCVTPTLGLRQLLEINEAVIMYVHQGLTNPLPGRPGQAPNWAGQVRFPARRPAGQVKENFKSSERLKVACIKGQLRRYLRM